MTLGEPWPPSSPTERLGLLAQRFAAFTPKRILAASLGRAAVALVLRQQGSELEMLLIRRAQRSEDPWSGHIGLPGGRSSLPDRSPLDTARRETREEVGLCLADHAKVLGSLDDLHAAARGRRMPLVITPFVFELFGRAELTVDPAEVEEAFWVALSELRRPETQAAFRFTEGGSSIDLPATRVGRHLVWGLTYRMLQGLFDLMDPG